jgi:hypothetical protein
MGLDLPQETASVCLRRLGNRPASRRFELSQRNGEKARFQINRKRTLLRRAKIRALVAAGATAEKRPAHAKPKPKE